jgi:DNA modification methylase
MRVTFRLVSGDCLDALAEMPEASVDAVVTDPPYGLSAEPDAAEVLRHWLDGDDYEHRGGGFMGKTWDSFVPGPKVWAECLRVLKPGGHLLAFFGTRTYDLGAMAIRLAGFEIRDCLAWMYGSGFPKSLDVSKAIDKAAGAEREVVGHTDPHDPRTAMARKMYGTELQDGAGQGTPITVPATPAAQKWQGWGTALKPAFEPIILARKPLTGTVAANVTSFGVGSLNIDGCRIGKRTDGESGQGRSGETDPGGNGPGRLLGLRQDGPEVEVKHQEGEMAADLLPKVPGRSDERTVESALQGSLDREENGLPNGEAGPSGRGNAGATATGQEGNPGASSGYGENDRPLAEGARTRSSHQRRQGRQSTGEPNPDGLVGTFEGASPSSSAVDPPRNGEQGAQSRDRTAEKTEVAPAGRWPANVILDPEAGAMLDEMSGERPGGTHEGGGGGGIWSPSSDGIPVSPGYGDTGGASRFFYCAKASRAERNAGLDGFEERETRGNYGDGIQDARPHTSEGYEYRATTRNSHPTVKPIDLMRYLVRLVTPPGGTVLDPFTGSGTTGIAAGLEGFDFIGIEREAEYREIAEARLKWWADQEGETADILQRAGLAEKREREAKESGQVSLFGGKAA